MVIILALNYQEIKMKELTLSTECQKHQCWHDVKDNYTEASMLTSQLWPVLSHNTALYLWRRSKRPPQFYLGDVYYSSRFTGFNVHNKTNWQNVKKNIVLHLFFLLNKKKSSQVSLFHQNKTCFIAFLIQHKTQFIQLRQAK